MRYLHLYSTLLFFSLLFSKEESSIRGVILDYSNQKPLPGANIYIENSDIGTVSNDLGAFSLPIDNLKINGAGVISATTQFSGSLAKKVYDDFKKTGSSPDDEKLKAIRTAFDETGNIITSLHTLKSFENKAYANLLPPLELLSKSKKEELVKKLKKLGALTDKNIAA